MASSAEMDIENRKRDCVKRYVSEFSFARMMVDLASRLSNIKQKRKGVRVEVALDEMIKEEEPAGGGENGS